VLIRTDPEARRTAMTRTTLSSLARCAASTAVVTGAAVLVTAPAYAGIAPEAPVAVSSASQKNNQPGKAQVEHDERVAANYSPGPQVKAQIEGLERAQVDAKLAPGTSGQTSEPSAPSSIPMALLLLGAGLATGAAGYTVYRFRQHGPVGAAPA